jgi:hypothetical protein
LYAWWRTASSSPSASSCPTVGPRRALTPPWTGGNPWRRVRLSCCFRPRPWRTLSSSTRALSTAPTCSATSPTSTAASTHPRSSRSRCGRWTFVLTQLSHAPRSPSVHGGGCTTSREVERRLVVPMGHQVLPRPLSPVFLFPCHLNSFFFLIAPF